MVDASGTRRDQGRRACPGRQPRYLWDRGRATAARHGIEISSQGLLQRSGRSTRPRPSSSALPPQGADQLGSDAIRRRVRGRLAEIVSFFFFFSAARGAGYSSTCASAASGPISTPLPGAPATTVGVSGRSRSTTPVPPGGGRDGRRRRQQPALARALTHRAQARRRSRPSVRPFPPARPSVMTG